MMNFGTDDRVSERQQDFLRFMKNYEEMHGHPPTFKEIAIGLDITSKGSVSAMINMLSSMGLVEKADGRMRGTRTRDPVQG
jgi:SOS-response transcriptional repressor LexA